MMKKIFSFVLVALATMLVTISCTGVDTPDNPSVPTVPEADAVVKDAFEKGALVTIQFVYRGEPASITFENTGEYTLTMVEATGAAVNSSTSSLFYWDKEMAFMFSPARGEDGSFDGMYSVDFDVINNTYSDQKDGGLEGDDNTSFISLSVNGRPVNLMAMSFTLP
jgi:hypothetical protein